MTTTTEEGPPPGPSSGRFHFDPEHDPSRTPPLEALVAWARGLLDDESTHMARMAGIVGGWNGRRGLMRRLLARRSRRRAGERCMAEAERELARVHDVAREFGIDPLAHPMLATRLDELLGAAAISVAVADQRRFVEEHPELEGPGMDDIRRMTTEIDPAERIERVHAHIRGILENEAVLNILRGRRMQGDRRRQIDALRAALDEVQDEDVRTAIRRTVAAVGD